MWHLTHSELFVRLYSDGLCWETRWFDPRGWWYNCTTFWGHGTTGGWIRSDGKLGLRSILLLLQNYCAIKSFVLPSFYNFLSTFSQPLRTSFFLAVLHKRPKMNFVNTFPFLKCCNQSRITLCRQKNHQRGFSNCPHVFVTELSVVKLLFAWFHTEQTLHHKLGKCAKMHSLSLSALQKVPLSVHYRERRKFFLQSFAKCLLPWVCCRMSDKRDSDGAHKSCEC